MFMIRSKLSFFSYFLTITTEHNYKRFTVNDRDSHYYVKRRTGRRARTPTVLEDIRSE